jgi:peptidoglycan/xylan/chitin deacetylase (PgdA/CDA1 family)
MAGQVRWVWPEGKRIAVVFNVCLEAWSDGKAPGISPMGNPLPAEALDTMAVSWAAYGVKRGIYRLLDALAQHRAVASVMVNAVIAERAPQAVRAIADAGHEVLCHSYAMDVIPALLSEEEERANIARCTALLEKASGRKIEGWLSPRGTSRADTPRMMLDSFDENVAIARETGELALIDVTCHAHIFGHPRGAYFYGKIVAAAAADPDIWIGTRAEIARHVLAQKAA